MTDTESTEPAARSGPTLADLASELGVSMRRAVALVTQAGEPLHQIWCGPEPISPEIADLARRLHRDTDPERPLFGVPVTPDQERISRLYAVGGRVEALLNAGGSFWVETKETYGDGTWRADVRDKVTGIWFTLTVQDLEDGERAPAAAPQGATVRDLELHQPTSTTIAQASAERTPDTSVGNLMTELGVSPKDIVEWVLVARRTLGDAAVHGPFDRSDPFWGEAMTGAASDAIRTWARQQADAEKTANSGRVPEPQAHPSMGDAVGYAMEHNARLARTDAGSPPQGITVRDLALELHQPVSTTIAQASAYSEATGRDPYQARVTWIGDWVLTPQAAQWIRALVRSEKLPASGPCSVPGQPREAAQAASPDPEDVAELLIRQDMALSAVDDGPERIPEDTAVLEWAVRTAGHRFDPHTLWDYDLLTDTEHVHRCLDHRHTGPNTRGPVRRG